MYFPFPKEFSDPSRVTSQQAQRESFSSSSTTHQTGPSFSTCVNCTMTKKSSGGAAATSNNVYVMDKEFGWIPARLVDQQGEKAVVSIPTYGDEAAILSDGGKGAKSWREETISLKYYPGKSLPLQNVSKSGTLVEKEDMVDLPFLHEVSFDMVIFHCPFIPVVMRRTFLLNQATRSKFFSRLLFFTT